MASVTFTGAFRAFAPPASLKPGRPALPLTGLARLSGAFAPRPH